MSWYWQATLLTLTLHILMRFTFRSGYAKFKEEKETTSYEDEFKGYIPEINRLQKYIWLVILCMIPGIRWIPVFLSLFLGVMVSTPNGRQKLLNPPRRP